jgi:hypothetical protein
MARASAHVNPKYVCGEEQFACPRSVDFFASMVSDYLHGTFKRSQAEKTALQTEVLFEVAFFFKRRGWFAADQAKGAAISKYVFDFWTIASQTDSASGGDSF